MRPAAAVPVVLAGDYNVVTGLRIAIWKIVTILLALRSPMLQDFCSHGTSLLKEGTRIGAAPADVLSSLPFGLAMVSTWLAGPSCDRSGQPKKHTILPMLAARVLCGLTAIRNQPAAFTLVWLSLTVPQPLPGSPRSGSCRR